MRRRYLRKQRYPRRNRESRMAELIRWALEHHKLTDAVRQRCVVLYWHEIAGAQIDAITTPVAVRDGVLQLFARSSSLVGELHYRKKKMLGDIAAWFEKNRSWLGPPITITEIRVRLDMPQRHPLVDRGDVQHLRAYDVRRRTPRPRIAPPPPSSGANRDAIVSETARIEDPALRAVIAAFRTTWDL